MERKDYLVLLVFLALPQLAGFIGSIFTRMSVSTWYVTLQKPVFSPPNWIFSPVWITLFLLMGIAAFLVWKKEGIKLALGIFFVQLALNTLWSILFFGLQSPLLAFIEIIVLWFAILATIILFWKVSRTAAYLLLPYVLWVSFAAVLNFSLFWLN